jgi:uncharacterized membrane protein
MSLPERLAEIDARLAGGQPGQEDEMRALLAERDAVLRALLPNCRDAAELDRIRNRTVALQQRLAHWRRMAAMEWDEFEQRLRFLALQKERERPLRIDCEG